MLDRNVMEEVRDTWEKVQSEALMESPGWKSKEEFNRRISAKFWGNKILIWKEVVK